MSLLTQVCRHFETQNAELRGHIDQRITQLRSDLEQQIQASRSETMLLISNLRHEMMQQSASHFLVFCTAESPQQMKWLKLAHSLKGDGESVG